MTFVIITRTNKTDTIPILKSNIKKVFGQKKNYIHYIICDLTGGVSKEDFRKYEDEKTALWFVDKTTKRDKYCTHNIDDLIATLKWSDDYWIYILDHDNLLRNNFTELEQYCNKQTPVLVFNIQTAPIWKEFDGIIKKPFVQGKALCYVNSANYLAHVSVFDKCKHGSTLHSQIHDGLWMEQVLYYKIPIKYLNQFYGYHNALKQGLGEY